jgi:hypothetical protein
MTTDNFADLPSLEDIRKQLLTAASVPARRPRRVRLLGWRRTVAVVIALAVPAGAAIATISQQDEDQHVHWQSVAQGRDPNYGRYEIVNGLAGRRECFGINLPDQNLPGVARAISATCADNPALSVAFMRGQPGTLAYGVTSAQTQSVTLSGPGQPPRHARLINGPGDTTYFVVSSPERIPKAQITALDNDGQTIAQQTLPD